MPQCRCVARSFRRRSGLAALNTGTMFGVGLGNAVAQPARAHPARGCRLADVRNMDLRRFWDAVTAPEAAAAIRLTVGSVADRRADQRSDGDADRVGPGPRLTSAASASSTR